MVGKKNFHFDLVSINGISKIINSVNPTKKMNGAILTKIVKAANNQIHKDFANCFNECTKRNIFPREVIITDTRPIFKKEYPLDPANYQL